ncbi:MAG: hypothetical protein Q8Q63_15910 [Phaeovulum sp.]|uniref:hypothetical protein n=2 Tax=Phaeovulum sp. TaxID=2934796 RepID=UPI0027358EAC|nr:hypothetical protein [Phaeovulum sp.]MDP3863059.1 hypothetical protein [Phaeovulum sp.]
MHAIGLFRPFLTDPALRLAALLMMLYGAFSASVTPYVSTLAVNAFGLGDSGFALVLVAASLVSVASAVGLGILADQRSNRRLVAMVAVSAMLLGVLAVPATGAASAFVLAHALALPLSTVIFGHIFAFARLAASAHPPDARNAILATLRALFALPFIVVLPLWSLAFSRGTGLMTIYPVAAVLAAFMLALTYARWPREGTTRWQDPRSGLSFAGSLRELAVPRVLARVALLGTVNGAITLYIVLIALVMTETPGRGPADVALYVGFVAGLEVPFMMASPLIARHLPRNTLILIGTVLYMVHLVAMPMLVATPYLWLLPLPAAAGGALVMTLPIAYLQDLLGARPGAGVSLLAVQRLAGDIFAAAAFALGTWIAGYAFVAVLGAGLAIAGITTLWLLDRN